MGDGADMAIEQGMNEEEYRYDHPYEFEDENADYSPVSLKHKTVKCQRCNTDGLIWRFDKEEDKWRLFYQNGDKHRCAKLVTCKRCGEKKLYWKETIKNKNWRLFDTKHEIHVCKGKQG